MSQRTEPPTPKKIRDARKKGNVPHSRELISAATFVSVTCFLMLFFHSFVEIISFNILNVANLYSLDAGAASAIIIQSIFNELFSIILPILFLVVSISILFSISNIGFLFAPEVIKPDLKKLNPIEGFKKIFSMKNLVEFLKSCLKVIILGFIIYQIIIASVPLMVNSIYCGLPCVLAVFKNQMWKIIIYTDLIFIAIAVFDVAFQRWDYIKKLRMSKEEVIREYKETEGDPLIKSKRSQLHQEMIRQNISGSVKKSIVVVTNPTHLAVGLHYEKDKNQLPIISVKGKNEVAKYIVKLAHKYGIPVTQNISVARALYDCKILDYIPKDLIIPIAEIVKWSMRHNLKKDST